MEQPTEGILLDGLVPDESLFEASEELRLALFALFRRRRVSAAVHEGVTDGEVHLLMVLMRLSRDIEEVRPSTIVEHCHITKSALSQQLGSLERKGLLVRRRALKDSRAVVIELTEAGHALCEKEMAAHRDYTVALLEYIGEEDVRHLARTVRRILAFQGSYYGPDSSKSDGIHRPGPGDFPCA